LKSYKLNIQKDIFDERKFTKEELLKSSTYKLKQICSEYRIVNAFKNIYKREQLIDLILKYRGKDVSYLIYDKQEGGMARIQEALEQNVTTKLKNNNIIKIPTKIILYDEIGMSEEDSYRVTVEDEIVESNVLLVNGDKDYICGIFNLKRDKKEENKYYLVANHENLRIENFKKKNYKLLFFKRHISEYLYKVYYENQNFPPMNLQYYEVPIIHFEVRKLEETKSVLCIDFGTSNTTAGVYLDHNYVSKISDNDIFNNRIKLDEINFVNFPYVGRKGRGWSKIIPTSVYVLNCHDLDNIRFLFGHEAQERIKENNYAGNASFFQGIKRWVNTYKVFEEIRDEAGNIAKITRGEIIKAYIDYVINTSESQFKCKFKKLYISSPVKLKNQFISMFQDIVPDYQIESDNVLDEGIAVLYNTIVNQINNESFYDGDEYKALVIDCGGGTTDLSSCNFKIVENDISYGVDIKTGFENGDSNFGGNNLTYRIMQFMKIVLAHYYQNNSEIIDIDQLIPLSGVEIFRHVDDFGVDSVYAKLKEYYQRAEELIPTRYKEYENRPAEEYKKVKNNFYFLWELAENMKKDFYIRTNILRNKFDSFKNMRSPESDLQITPLSNWELAIYEEGKLEVVNEFPNVIFNVIEINKLIKADIYDIIRKLLEKFYENQELLNYSIIKLTGQSCKIDIFTEALKEFVPGRRIQFKKKNINTNDDLDLKLSCLRGIIKHVNSKKLGNIEINVENEVPIIPYSISAFDFNGNEKTIIRDGEKLTEAKGYISKLLSTREIKFYLKNIEGELQKEYLFENEAVEYTQTSSADILKRYSTKVSQEDTDTIRNDEVKLFVFTAEDKWGFYIVPICRQSDQLYIGDERYFTFEDDLSTLDFFDGLK
jgi:hypothetical protein